MEKKLIRGRGDDGKVRGRLETCLQSIDSILNGIFETTFAVRFLLSGSATRMQM